MAFSTNKNEFPVFGRQQSMQPSQILGRMEDFSSLSPFLFVSGATGPQRGEARAAGHSTHCPNHPRAVEGAEPHGGAGVEPPPRGGGSQKQGTGVNH